VIVNIRILWVFCLALNAFVMPGLVAQTPISIIAIDPRDPAIALVAAGAISKLDSGDTVFHFRNSKPSGSDIRVFELPIDSVRGQKVRIRAEIRGDSVSQKPNSWNGVKIMLMIDTPSGTNWPQIPVGVGTFDWQKTEGLFLIPSDAIKVSLVLSLELVTGELWMRDITLTLKPIPAPVPPAPRDQPVFLGHGPKGLRGAMVDPDTMTRADFDVLTCDWGANLVRWQLKRPVDEAKDFRSYDLWLDKQLIDLDKALVWAAENGTRVVVDLHSPPGGGDSVGGYQDAGGDLFRVKAAQDHFVGVWEKIAARYRGNDVIWGFDLVNEPVDNGTTESCLDWNDLALRASLAIRKIDPNRTLIVEPAEVGSALGMNLLRPLPLSGVVYSFHFYQPFEFTHQGVFSSSALVRYPGTIDGTRWDKAALEKALEPAIRFAETYRVQLYVGEFGAVRWAPGADRYLSDLISIFEEHGWAWTFHAFREWQGWSPEHDTNRGNENPVKGETARMKVLKAAFKKNHP
jgi:hypothetical protein